MKEEEKGAAERETRREAGHRQGGPPHPASQIRLPGDAFLTPKCAQARRPLKTTEAPWSLVAGMAPSLCRSVSVSPSDLMTLSALGPALPLLRVGGGGSPRKYLNTPAPGSRGPTRHAALRVHVPDLSNMLAQHPQPPNLATKGCQEATGWPVPTAGTRPPAPVGLRRPTQGGPGHERLQRSCRPGNWKPTRPAPRWGSSSKAEDKRKEASGARGAPDGKHARGVRKRPTRLQGRPPARPQPPAAPRRHGTPVPQAPLRPKVHAGAPSAGQGEAERGAASQRPRGLRLCPWGGPCLARRGDLREVLGRRGA